MPNVYTIGEVDFMSRRWALMFPLPLGYVGRFAIGPRRYSTSGGWLRTGSFVRRLFVKSGANIRQGLVIGSTNFGVS
jgi:hypothetical protein